MLIKWIGDRVPCSNSDLTNRNYDFYRSCEIDNVSYTVGDFVLFNKTSSCVNAQVCKLLCLYESLETWHKNNKFKATVKWFTWARDLETDANPTLVEFDIQNEVVEDLRKLDNVISLENIKGRCSVVFVTEDDPVHYVSNSRKNGKNLIYSCRYTINSSSNRIKPLISYDSLLETSRETFKNLALSPKAKKVFQHTSPVTRGKRSCKPIKSDSESDSEQKLPSPSKSRKVNVKTDLNDSIESSLNYSIAEQSPDSLKMKLRVSRNQPNETSPERRKSSRIGQQFSHTDKTHDKKQSKTTTRLSSINLDLFNVKNLQVIVEDIAVTKPKLFPKSPEKENQRSLRSRTSLPRKPIAKRITRSSTSSRTSVNYRDYSSEDEKLTLTPKSTNTRKNIQDELPQTPKVVKSIKNTRKSVSTPTKMVSTPKSTKKDTPSIRVRLIREGVITPSVQSRGKQIVKDSTPLGKAKVKLHVSHVPKSLPCRENEFSNIFNFLQGKLLDGCGGCMYISGVPGTGKTATVTEVILSLQKLVENDDIPHFDYVNVNGMKLSEPRYVYVEIVKQLLKKTTGWEEAQNILEQRFTKFKRATPTLLVVDELDILCTKRQDVVYNLLDWPTKSKTQLIVITIANTMNLPETLLMGRVTSRLGLTRLTFQAYTHKQLQEIVTKRLIGINAFNPDAIQLVARKVASVSGDARRALDICRRAAEIAEIEGKNTLVTMTHVNSALNAMITQPKVQAIKRCSKLEKLILRSLVAEVERTGVEETTFNSIYMMLISVAVLYGVSMPSVTLITFAISKLAACRLILADSKVSSTERKILLNASADDVYYALDAEL